MFDNNNTTATTASNSTAKKWISTTAQQKRRRRKQNIYITFEQLCGSSCEPNHWDVLLVRYMKNVFVHSHRIPSSNSSKRNHDSSDRRDNDATYQYNKPYQRTFPIHRVSQSTEHKFSIYQPDKLLGGELRTIQSHRWCSFFAFASFFFISFCEWGSFN